MRSSREESTNERERWRETVLFGMPDKIPFEPGEPRESTLDTWRRQGLPEGVDWRAYLLHLLDLPQEPDHVCRDLNIAFGLLPSFEEQVLEHRDGHLTVQDRTGAIVEMADQYDFTYLRQAKDLVTRRWHRFPVQTRADWEEKIRWRYDAKSPGRFPADFAARGRALRDRDHLLKLTVPGVFWQLREWCGFENLCIFLIQEPDFIHAMVGFWADFVLQMFESILQHVTPDYIQISEDMAYKEHSMVSPATARRFFLPAWKKWTALLRTAGCPILSVDSDGYIAELLPLWIEAGLVHTWPVEVAAGNDIVAYRERYGRQIAFGGGIDKRALAAGGETMRTHVLRVVPPLLREGGYVPGCDHGVPADVAWSDFVEYASLLAQLTGWRD